MEILGVMTDMDEGKEDKLKNFRVRAEQFRVTVDQMNESEQSVKSINELRLEDEELDKEMREKLNACFTHEV